MVVIGGPSLGDRFPLTRDRVVIGRHASADIVLDDPAISRNHAELIVEKRNLVILRDLGSRNGTSCNEKPVVQKKLEDGDIVRIGESTLKFVGPNSVEQLFVKELSERATRDGLTGIFNRQTFYVYLERSLSRCRDLNEPISVAIADIDWFKKINDTVGHTAGDFILKEFSHRVSRSIRPTDLLARIGGEEFGVIFPHTKLLEGQIVAERIRSRVGNSPFSFYGKVLSVTVSLGVAERADTHQETAEMLVARADQALYQAKHDGRNRSCLASSSGHSVH